MTALQKTLQGTPPKALDGDDIRTFGTRFNLAVDILNKQATLTSVAAALRDLTVADMGKRVNMTPTAAGTSRFPAASTCGADQIVSIHNLSPTYDITMAIATGSGDTAPTVVVIKPGECNTYETDGASVWRTIGRKKPLDETVQGKLTVLGALTIAGKTPWDSGNYLDTTGHCYLAYTSATVLTLSPRNGNTIPIGGALYTIPAAGVTLSSASTVAATLYYIYAYASSAGAVALEYSTTASATDTTTGVTIKNGDASRTLVGKAYVATAATWADSTSRIGVLSYFNRISRVLAGTNAGGQANVATSWVTLTGLAWADEAVTLTASGNGSMSTATSTMTASVRVDAAAVGSASVSSQYYAGYAGALAPSWTGLVTATALHTYDVYASCNNSGTLTMSTTLTVVTRG